MTCGGTFVKDTTHLKLAIKYDSRNIVFGEVDGPDGTKIKATILYPNESKRRLEVIWNNDAARTDLSMVVINGQSQWTAPKGLKLGTPLAALEKINGRPFKLSGFDADGSASVLGWEGGALTSLPGGCKVGVRLAADSKAAARRAWRRVGRQGIAVQRRQPEGDQAVRSRKSWSDTNALTAFARPAAKISKLRPNRRDNLARCDRATWHANANSEQDCFQQPLLLAAASAEYRRARRAIRAARRSAAAPKSPTVPSR